MHARNADSFMQNKYRIKVCILNFSDTHHSLLQTFEVLFGLLMTLMEKAGRKRKRIIRITAIQETR